MALCPRTIRLAPTLPENETGGDDHGPGEKGPAEAAAAPDFDDAHGGIAPDGEEPQAPSEGRLENSQSLPERRQEDQQCERDVMPPRCRQESGGESPERGTNDQSPTRLFHCAGTVVIREERLHSSSPLPTFSHFLRQVRASARALSHINWIALDRAGNGVRKGRPPARCALAAARKEAGRLDSFKRSLGEGRSLRRGSDAVQSGGRKARTSLVA